MSQTMSFPDWSTPLAYMLLGALLLWVLLRVWQKLARRQTNAEPPAESETTRELASSAPRVEKMDKPPRTYPEAYWLWTTLTFREQEIARLAARDRRNAEIALECSLSVRTVETHLRNIYQKLKIHSRGELKHIVQDIVDNPRY